MKEDIVGMYHVLKLYFEPEVALLNLLHNHIKLDMLYRSEEYGTMSKQKMIII